MKKMKPVWWVCLLAFVSMFFYQSCLDDDDLYPWEKADKVTIATIKAVSDDENETEFYFLIDGGKKMYPGNMDNISINYKWVDGQRAFVYFDLLDEEQSGYDYNAQVVYIVNILTKGVIDMDEETADSIGDDKINFEFAWFGGDHLNIEFLFMGTHNPKELHMVNLVHNTMNENIVEDGYLLLEFRHNDYDDYPAQKLTGIVSFKPPFTQTDGVSYKGIKLRVNSIDNGVKYEYIDFDSEHTDGGTYSGKVLDIQ